MQRIIDGPDKDLMTLLEVADYLRLKPKTLRRLVLDGEFPLPLRPAARSALWGWEDVYYYRLRMTLRRRLRSKKPKDRKGQEPAPKGHRTPPKGQKPNDPP